MQPAIAAALRELRAVLEDLKVYVWPGKSQDQPTVFIMQVILNMAAHHWMAGVLKWDSQVTMRKLTAGALDENETVDFAYEVEPGKYLVVEVQFANQSRIECDLAKMRSLHAHGVLALGVLVNLKRATAVLADSGLATHELSKRKAAKSGLPLCMLGLSHAGSDEVNLSEIPGLALPTLLGGKGGDGSHELHEHVVEQLLHGVHPRDITLTDHLVELVRSHESAYFRKFTRKVALDVGLALKTDDPAIEEHLLRALEAGIALISRNQAARLQPEAPALPLLMLVPKTSMPPPTSATAMARQASLSF